MSAITEDTIKSYFTEQNIEIQKSAAMYICNLLDKLYSDFGAITEVSEFLAKLPKNVAEKYKSQIEQVLTNTEYTMYSYLIGSLLNDLLVSSIDEKIDNSFIRTPWDIKKGIIKNEILSEMFPTETTPTFDVVIKYNGDKFSYEMTEEFAYGMLTWFSNFTEEHNNILYIGAYPIELLHNNEFNNKFISVDDNAQPTNYSCFINDYTYKFDSLDFINGFTTGKMLVLNIEDYDEISSMKKYSQTDDQVEVEELVLY
jgi:hypothetical protein